MPIYEYTCLACEETFDKMSTVKDRDVPQPCPTCGKAESERKTSVSNFNLSGDGWAGKNAKIANQMAAKNQRLKKRQDERTREGPGYRLAPNVDGERVDSWSEASKLAKSKGKDTTVYEKKARDEKGSR